MKKNPIKLENLSFNEPLKKTHPEWLKGYKRGREHGYNEGYAIAKREIRDALGIIDEL